MVPRALWEGGGEGNLPTSKNQDQTAGDLTRRWANGPGVLGVSWAQLGASWAPLGLNLGALGRQVRPSARQVGPPWALLGAKLGCPSAKLDRSHAKLGRSRAKLGRSRAKLDSETAFRPPRSGPTGLPATARNLKIEIPCRRELNFHAFAASAFNTNFWLNLERLGHLFGAT